MDLEWLSNNEPPQVPLARFTGLRKGAFLYVEVRGRAGLIEIDEKQQGRLRCLRSSCFGWFGNLSHNLQAMPCLRYFFRKVCNLSG
jgi:hypothetical protein